MHGDFIIHENGQQIKAKFSEDEFMGYIDSSSDLDQEEAKIKQRTESHQAQTEEEKNLTSAASDKELQEDSVEEPTDEVKLMRVHE